MGFDVHAEHAGDRIELASNDPMYEDMALKFAEHFIWIAAP